MKTLILTAVIVLTAASAAAQSLPDAPAARPAASKGVVGRFLTVDHALIASDGALRILDTYTSVKAFTDPCHCLHESDPLSPGSGKVLPTVAFQAGMFVLVSGGSVLLKHHHHPRLARALLILDNGSEGYAVVNNFRNLGYAASVDRKNESMHGLIPLGK